MAVPTYQEIADSAKVAIKDIIDGKTSQYTISGRQNTRLSLSSIIEAHGWAEAGLANENGETFVAGKWGIVQ